MKEQNYIDIANIILKNIEEQGLKRFDRMDIKWNPQIFYPESKWNKVRGVFLVLDELFPYFIRKKLHISKREFPNTYDFIIHALYVFEKNGIDIKSQYNACWYMEKCLKKYVTIENGEVWWNYEKEQFSNVKDTYQNKRPTMHMYGLARLNRLLIDMGQYYKKDEWIWISQNSLEKTFIQNNLVEEKETAYISYFYNSDDYIINANTEFADWMATVLQVDRKEKYEKLLVKFINMVKEEQNDDGSWYYYSKKNNENLQTEIDCHHSATVLYNLIHILEKEILPYDKQKELTHIIDRGMKYYLDTFFSNIKQIRTYTDKKRPAGVAQYSEAIFTFCLYLENRNKFSAVNVKRIESILPVLVKKNCKFINFNNGSAKGEKVIRWVNIDSIRWGNGPVLEAIAYYLQYLVKEEKKSV